MIQNTKSSVSFPPIFQIFLLFFVQKHHWNNFLLYSYPFDYTGNGKTRGEAMIGVIASPNINPGKLALLATSTHNCYYVILKGTVVVHRSQTGVPIPLVWAFLPSLYPCADLQVVHSPLLFSLPPFFFPWKAPPFPNWLEWGRFFAKIYDWL